MNYKPENRIPWLLTDFDNINDFPWLFKKFPDFSLTLIMFVFPWLFPDRGNPVIGVRKKGVREGGGGGGDPSNFTAWGQNVPSTDT